MDEGFLEKIARDAVIPQVGAAAFFLGPFAAWAPIVFFALLIGVASYFYARGDVVRIVRRILWAAVGFRVGYALFVTFAQYYLWAQSPVTRQLLEKPIGGQVPPSLWIKFFQALSPDRLEYFLFYSWGRFWLEVVWLFVVAGLFYVFLRFLRSRQDRFFLAGEPELGLLAALSTGWPGVVVFLPLVFAAVVVVSLFRLLVFRKQYTTLGWPLLLAAFLTLLYGLQFVDRVGLSVLKI